MQRLFPILLVAMLLGTSGALTGLVWPQAASAADCVAFPETGHQVCGRFLAYWQEHGGLAQQGYPLSEPFLERSTVDSHYYQVQYFERAIFEWHQENAAPNDVLLTQLGREALHTRYPSGVPSLTPAPSASPAASPAPSADPNGCAAFPQTGFQVCGPFLTYWQAHGGLAQQGYPLSGVFAEKSVVDGKTYQVQYFERAVFELHPELTAPDNVLLSLLGRERLLARYPYGAPLTFESDYVSLGQITLKTTGTSYVEWSGIAKNISDRPLVSLSVSLALYNASDQLLDTSLAAEQTILPGETRILHGLSIKGVGYAKYQIKSVDVVAKP